jgi:hypothetical protein
MRRLMIALVLLSLPLRLMAGEMASAAMLAASSPASVQADEAGDSGDCPLHAPGRAERTDVTVAQDERCGSSPCPLCFTASSTAPVALPLACHATERSPTTAPAEFSSLPLRPDLRPPID